MKTFLEDLKNELIKRKMNQSEIDDIIKDHEEMIQEALREGLAEEDIQSRFGDPKELAKELSAQCSQEETKVVHEDYTLWKSLKINDPSYQVMINLVSEDLIVQSSEDDNAHLYAKGHGKLEDYTFTYDQGELRLEAPKSKGLIFMRISKEDVSFVLELPKRVDISACTLKTVSSDIKITYLQAENFKLSTTSGDLDLSCATLKQMKLNTVSGDFHLSHVTSDEADLSFVNGDLDMAYINIKEKVHANTVSGDIKWQDSEVGAAEFHVVSGDVKGEEFYPKTIVFKSVSGDLVIRNNEKRDVTLLKGTTLSGEISIKP